jgi:nitrogen-specific signal transduction histidine kinase/CheY-like chemotaxis protein
MRPVRGEDGAVAGIVVESVETTARLMAEEAVRQSQKIEALGQLTGGVAHDFNNLLTPIIGSLDMLQRRGVGTDREQALIEGALLASERARTLVERLLAFARRQPLRPKSVDIAKLVEGMFDLLSSSIGPRIQIEVRIAPDLPPAMADANQIEMALLNLCVNARDAMPDGGTLTISASLDEATTGHRAKAAPGAYILIAVADTGTGMDAATLQHAFEPFFSTKEVGKGTGLGLSMVHGLAHQLGGVAAIASAVGVGTTVELWLPASETAPESTPIDAPGLPAPSSGGTVLLIDDEDVVRANTAAMLEDMGYVVIQARSAEIGQSLLDAGRSVDLLITDHLMPGMSGADFARGIRQSHPSLRVLILSGYSEASDIASELPLLSKPFRSTELVSALGRLKPVTPRVSGRKPTRPRPARARRRPAA